MQFKMDKDPSKQHPSETIKVPHTLRNFGITEVGSPEEQSLKSVKVYDEAAFEKDHGEDKRKKRNIYNSGVYDESLGLRIGYNINDDSTNLTPEQSKEFKIEEN